MIGFNKNKLNPFQGYRAPIGLALGASAATATAVGISAVGLGVSALGTVQSAAEQRKAAKEQRNANLAQARAAEVSEARNRIQATREARIKRAMIESSAGNQQVGGSGLAGGTSSVASQFGGNIGYSNTMQSFGAIASAANQKASDAMSSASMWQSVGGLAGNMTNWQSIFNPKGVPSVGQMQTSAQKPSYFKTVN